jgi:GMP synthase (glutamine-hydrolysing)
MMRPLLVIQTGEAPEPIRVRFGGFAEWFRIAMRIEPARVRVVHVAAGEPLPEPGAIVGAVITGSAAMVTERTDWSERTAAWIRAAIDAGTPLFGVCYGHQLMAHALGGSVGWLPSGREIGTRAVIRRGRGGGDWLDLLPATFPAHTTHRQSVLEAPRGAEVMAASELDPHQILRYAPYAISTQFNPEFTAYILRAYIDARADVLREEGFDVAALRAGVRDTGAARGLLERFAQAALSEGSEPLRDAVRALPS